MTKIMKGAEVVCHTAAYAHEGLSSFSPTLISNNIVTGSTSVFTAAIKNKLKRIVFCSSMARYGNIKTPFKENDILNPVDPYGVAKVAAENILKILSSTHDIEYNIAVPHNIIGPKQKYDDPYRNVVSLMVNLMLQKRQAIIFGDGKQVRDVLFINDLVKLFFRLSKSKKNVIDPEFIIKNYGADAVRLFILSDSPPEKDVQWSEQGMVSSYKFVQKLWILHCEIKNKISDKNDNDDKKIEKFANQL